MKRSLLIPSLFALSLPGAPAQPATSASELRPLQEMAVQDGGRVKPLDTYARELAKRVQGAKPFGLERVAGLEPIEWLLASLASPERWQAEAIVKVTHAGLRQAAGLPAGRDRFSLQELAAHEGLRAAAAAVRAKLDRDEELDPIDREVLELENTLGAYQGVTTGESLRVVPHPDDPKAAWFSIADLHSEEAADIPQLGRLRALSDAMLEAYRSGDRQGVATAARAFSARLGELAPTVYPAAKGLRMEVHYNTLKPFRSAWLLYLAGFLVLLASFPLASRALRLAGYAALVGGFLLNSYGLVLRVLISGRPPVTNMYETIVFVAWGGLLFALLFEAFYETHVFAACAGGLGAIALIIADSVPIFDGAISPLVPVLRDNMWLTVHVLTIISWATPPSRWRWASATSTSPLLLPSRRRGRSSSGSRSSSTARCRWARCSWRPARSWAACGPTTPGAASGAGTPRRPGRSSRSWGTWRCCTDASRAGSRTSAWPWARSSATCWC